MSDGLSRKTLFARTPLSDCERGYGLLTREQLGSETWRVHWVACLALLRAVGHVLKNIDGETDAKHRDCIDKAWTRWKQDRKGNSIFWEFIEEERNNLLKEYKFGVVPEPELLTTETGDVLGDEKDEPLETGDIYYKSSRTDTDGGNAISQAIAWWKQQLDAIETELKG
jgi:hypothetical protein